MERMDSVYSDITKVSVFMVWQRNFLVSTAHQRQEQLLIVGVKKLEKSSKE